MSKLVLYLPDGTLHDIVLDKERLTIGRRADNDICLPYPAVSGEHAAVVTILDDSFLEDLGSTNGTLVNGKPVAKHFLRENDLIDIGRQRLLYFTHDGAVANPLPPDVLRREVIGLHEQVERARSTRQERNQARKATAAPGAGGPATTDPLMPDDELLAELEAAALTADARASDLTSSTPPPSISASVQGMPNAEPSTDPGTPVAAMERAAAQRLARPNDTSTSTVASRLASTWTPVDQTASLPAAGPAPSPAPVAPEPVAESSAPRFRVRVLDGANAGRELDITRDEVSVGRIGQQVARIAREGDEWRLAMLEGQSSLVLNGAPVPVAGATLAPGDHFEVAGVRLAFEYK